MTRLTPLRAVAISLAVALAFPAAARTGVDAAPVDTAPVAEAIVTFEAAFTGGDMAVLLAALPPALLTHIAARFDVGESDMRNQMAAAAEAAMAEVEVEAFGMDLDAAETGRTSEGRAYALVPTTAILSVEGGHRFRSVNTTLALEDRGDWYLMRADDPGQVALLREVYPDMAEIAFADGTMEPLE